MNSLDLLTQRQSNKKLVEPVPNTEQLEIMLRAAIRAPDHGRMMPYQFIVIEKQGLNKLEQLLKQACIEMNLDERSYQKAEKLARQSPMIIAVIAKIEPNIEKVPEWEQLVTAGCATYAIQLAANAMGFDNVWITAKWVNSEILRQVFDCRAQDKIVALLRIGTAEEKNQRETKVVDLEKFTTYWNE